VNKLILTQENKQISWTIWFISLASAFKFRNTIPTLVSPSQVYCSMWFTPLLARLSLNMTKW